MSCFLSLILASIAIYKKSFTVCGMILATFLAMIITYCGNLNTFLILVATFLVTMLASKITTQQKEDAFNGINEKHGKRDGIQVFCNVGVGAISLFLYHLTKREVYVIAYAAVMASSLADSMASEIGILSKGKTFDLRTLKPVSKGISGGVSRLGLVASFLGSLLIAIIFYFEWFSILDSVVIAVLGMIGALIDSILGSCLQVKYRCQKCHKVTEKKYHCQMPTHYEKGLKFLNNDAVNLMNNIITLILVMILYI